MKVSFTGITIYKTNMQNPYYTFAHAIEKNKLENKMMALPCIKDSKSVMILDGEDYRNYLNRMVMLDGIYSSCVDPSYRERKVLEKKATVVDLTDLNIKDSKKVTREEMIKAESDNGYGLSPIRPSIKFFDTEKECIVRKLKDEELGLYGIYSTRDEIKRIYGQAIEKSKQSE